MAPFVQGGEEPAFAEHEHGAAGIAFAKEIRRVQRGRVEVARRQAVNAQMIEPHCQILRRRRGVVRGKQKRRAGGGQGIDKIRRAGNQLVFPVNDAVHVNQVAGFHRIQTWWRWSLGCRLRREVNLPAGRERRLSVE
jgi:hypothetical protein